MVDLAAQFGYLGIMVLLVLTGMGLPLPEEVPVIAAGIMAAHQVLNPWLALIACITGALMGDCVMYAVGYHFGHGLMREHPRFGKLLHAEREEKIERLIRRHGLKVFFVARFLVGVRCPIYLAAGTLRVPFRRFLLFDAFCATLVVGLFFGLSYAFAESITSWFDMIRQAEITLTVIVAIAVGAAAFYFWRRHKKRIRAAAEAADMAELVETDHDEDEAHRTRVAS